MTKEERVLKSIKREYEKGYPVCFSFSDENTKKYFENKLNLPSEKFMKYTDSDIKRIYSYDDLQMYVSNTNAVKYAIEKGFAFVKNKEGVLYDRTGVGWSIKSEGQVPVDTPLSSIEDVNSFKFPSVEKEGMFDAVEKNLSNYKKLGYAVMIPQHYSLYEKACVLMGYENFFISSYNDKNDILQFLDKIMNYRVELAKRIVQFPVTLGFTGDDFGTQNGPIMSIELWRELIKPRLKQIWDVYKKYNIPIIHHSCGDCRIYIDDMIEIGLDVLHPIQASAMPIEELSEKYADRLTFFGGIDCQAILSEGTPKEIISNVEKTVKFLGKNNGLILAATNIMKNADIRNLKVLMECVNSYRTVYNEPRN